MPCINIKAKRNDHHADIKALSQAISHKTDIGLDRINVLVDYYDEEDCFTHEENLIIFIYISKRNKESVINHLSQTTAALSEKYFKKKENSATVICNLIEEGHLLVKGTRK